MLLSFNIAQGAFQTIPLAEQYVTVSYPSGDAIATFDVQLKNIKSATIVQGRYWVYKSHKPKGDKNALGWVAFSGHIEKVKKYLK